MSAVTERLNVLVTNSGPDCHHHLWEISLFLFPPGFPFEPSAGGVSCRCLLLPPARLWL